MHTLRLVGEKQVLLATCTSSSSSALFKRCQHNSGDKKQDTTSASVQTHEGKKQPRGHILTDLRRGTGGRSSFSGMVATVFGATGVLGHSVLNQLGKIGTQIIVPYRGDKEDTRDLRLVGDLGQVLFQSYHLEDEESIRKAMRYSNVVINLIGRFHETRNFTFKQVHVDGAARIARIAREMGVPTLLHVSAMNNHEDPTPHIIKSKFLSTKARGEYEVRREFPEAIIFRPSYMFGQYDSFLFYFKAKYRGHRFGGNAIIPMHRSAMNAIKQPVAYSDVGQAIVRAVQNAEARGQTYQAVGPHRYRLLDLVRWIYMHMRYVPGKNFIVVPYVDPLLKMRHRFNVFLRPATAQVSLDRLEFECHSDEVSDNLPTLESLGLTLTTLEDRIAWELRPFRRYNYYFDAIGEFPTPPNPPLVTV